MAWVRVMSCHNYFPSRNGFHQAVNPVGPEPNIDDRREHVFDPVRGGKTTHTNGVSRPRCCRSSWAILASS